MADIYQPRVGTAALPGYRENIKDPRQAAIQQFSKGVQDLAKGAGDLANHIIAEQDNAAVNGAYADLATYKQATLSPKDGYLANQGEDALASYKDTRGEFDKKAKDIVANLKNDRQKAAFEKVLQRERLSFLDSIDRHAARQSEVVEEQKAQAATSAAINDAIGEASTATAPQDLARVTEAIAMGMGSIDRRGAIKGWSPEVIQDQHRDYATKAYIGVIDSLVAQGKTELATAYVGAAKSSGQLDLGLFSASGVEKRLNALGERDTAQTLANALFDEAGGDPVVAEALAREYAAGVPQEDPTAPTQFVEGYGALAKTAVFDETMQRLRQRAGSERQARQLRDSEPLGRLEQKVYGGPGFSVADPDYLALSDEGKGQALRMRRAERNQRLQNGADARRIQAEIDRAAAADYAAQLAANEDEAVGFDLGERYADATKRQRDMMVVQRERVKKAMERDKGVPYTAFKAKVTAEADRLGYGGVQGTKIEKGSKADRFAQAMNERYYDWLQQPGNEKLKAPPPEVIDKMIADATMEVVDKGLIWDTKLPTWEAVQKGLAVPTEEADYPKPEPKAAAPFVPPETPGGGRAPGAEAPAIDFSGAEGQTPLDLTEAEKPLVVPVDMRKLAIQAYRKKHGKDPSEAWIQQSYKALTKGK